MRKFTVLCSLLFVLCSAIVIPHKDENPSVDKSQKLDLKSITIDQFIKLKPSYLKKLTGETLTLKEKLVLSLMQKDLRRSVKKNLVDENTTVNFDQYFEEGKSKFDIGGFVLGLLLGLIGVGLAHIFSKDKNFRRSSWQGLGAWIIILLIFAVA